MGLEMKDLEIVNRQKLGEAIGEHDYLGQAEHVAQEEGTLGNSTI